MPESITAHTIPNPPAPYDFTAASDLMVATER